ncbi:MAG: class D beta-lactamase [Cyanobacteria bacterium P01_G01_bin.54]
MNLLLRLLVSSLLTTFSAMTSGQTALTRSERSVSPITPVVASDQGPSHQAVDFSEPFQDLEVEGSILIYDLKGDRTYQHNPERNQTAFLPASTFKILNSLIALETGVITSALAVLTWDGVERSFPAWNQDLNLRQAYKLSAVWFYQVLARRVGHERMQEWVAQVGYGNGAIGRPTEIDTFWLRGELRITPEEQIKFLQQLQAEELPFSAQTFAMVKDIMIVEQTPDYVIRAKTGWALETQVGWYVGYLERGEDVYFFATNLEVADFEELPKRQAITRRCLAQLGVL